MKPMDEGHFAVLRRHMVELITIYGDLMSEELGKAAFDERVLAAMMRVPRHRFVPAPLVPLAYQDAPLPIGFDKTISQPFICALMADLLAPEPTDSVLEIGTGLGYQAALLAELAGRVCSVEVVEELATEAAIRLRELGYANVLLRIGDGSRGWAEHAPYDRIMVTAAAEAPPAALLEQLRAGGRLVMPIGATDGQELMVFDRTPGGEVRARSVIPVRFTLLETVI
jgi:protein-L-isoaspartate(D-aspartate) O-methyltransferase